MLEHVTLAIPSGAHGALMGPSGCGKSTLLNLAAGLLSPAAGTVQTGGGRIAYVFQEPRLLPDRTALQNVNAVLGDKKATLPTAEEWLVRVGLGDAMDKYPAELSGGMAQRVNIARALAWDGDILLLDEPFRGVDEDRKETLVSLLREHTRNRTLLLATHDRTEAEALCDTVFVCRDRGFIPL